MTATSAGGAQTITSTSTSAVVVKATSAAGTQIITTGSGADTITASTTSVSNTIDTGAGNDKVTISATTSGSYTINGRAGDDILTGGAGNDTLNGGLNNDTLNGGAGNDQMTGDTGIDKFLYNTNAAFATSAVGVDTITDFTSGIDKIVLDKTTFNALKSGAGTGFSVTNEFAKVTSDSDAAISNALIVYNTGDGSLFYNQNGAAAGFGTGAQFDILTGMPNIVAIDFMIQA